MDRHVIMSAPGPHEGEKILECSCGWSARRPSTPHLLQLKELTDEWLVHVGSVTGTVEADPAPSGFLSRG